ncbi:GroES-like protein [Aspergillus pseudoustus]|uniref:GroES-like protein n=1 Tax=Aspergillus pseudoustus TaxID=1810923 RepID=A0ABR4L1L9_9EURO
MDAVIFKGPFEVAVERRPKPEIIEPTDAIVKVRVSGICGSDLHAYRGHQKTEGGYIMGHEFVGTVVKTGGDVKVFGPGDNVVSIFSPCCMKCWYCLQGLTNRCTFGAAFGFKALDGGQAEYVRIPHADGTLRHAPTGLDDPLLIMMADIFPTGYYAASRAIEALHTQKLSRLTSFPKDSSTSTDLQSLTADSVLVCLGCGPVGICAIAAARSKGIKTIFAVDSVRDRLDEARDLGAIPLQLGADDIGEHVRAATEGRGADGVIELVGNQEALRSAFDLLRPAGVLSSVGFHQADLPFTGLECYLKGLTVSFGRVPVATVFDAALECLKENEKALRHYVTHELPLAQAKEGYQLFEQHKARKVILCV